MRRLNRIFKYQRSSKGFTLVEMLVYMGLLSIFLVVQMDILVSVLETTRSSEANSSVAQDGRFILSRLGYDIQRASAITSPASVGSSSNTLTLTIGGVSHSYALTSGNLVLTNNLGSNNLNSNQTTVSAVNFTKIGSSTRETVKLEFAVGSVTQTQAGAEMRQFDLTVGKR